MTKVKFSMIGSGHIGGVSSTFLHQFKLKAATHGVPACDLLLVLGHRRTIAGQEDMIEDTALSMTRVGS